MGWEHQSYLFEVKAGLYTTKIECFLKEYSSQAFTVAFTSGDSLWWNSSWGCYEELHRLILCSWHVCPARLCCGIPAFLQWTCQRTPAQDYPQRPTNSPVWSPLYEKPIRKSLNGCTPYEERQSFAAEDSRCTYQTHWATLKTSYGFNWKCNPVGSYYPSSSLHHNDL